MAKTILVVDASRTVKRQLSMALKQASFDMLEDPDGQDCLATTDASRNIHMIIFDVNMPNTMIQLVQIAKYLAGAKAA